MYLSEEEKTLYFDSENLTFDKMDTKVTAWSGWPGVFHHCTLLRYLYDALHQIPPQVLYIYHLVRIA